MVFFSLFLQLIFYHHLHCFGWIIILLAFFPFYMHCWMKSLLLLLSFLRLSSFMSFWLFSSSCVLAPRWIILVLVIT
jgi:hypothetical protein